MRILTIGVGGAGSRIVDQLYYQDRRSSVSCISAFVVDTDGNFLNQLKYIPNDAKVFFPAIDPEVHFDVRSTVDVSEIMSKIKQMDNVDIDAIMIFTGLGGNLSDIIPDLTKEVRKSFFEPVFAVCTLPYLREGKRLATKAAMDIEMIEEFVDGIILFDNETWYRKIKASFEVRIDADGNPVNTPSPFGKSFPENPRDIYMMLNDKISRQIGLLLRAGEFNEEGIDSAEVVLDAGEVLNTLRGNGITAVGYAIEALPSNWTDIFEKWLPERQQTNLSEISQKRATRIVALAKKAVYEDISVPCDLTSADKALILIAGPSRELSMKGFQTVRKWIDSSIAGLEMRSGDYPVSNTKYVGIIIMLSGLHNIPRLEEIKKLRDDYLREQEEKKVAEEDQNLLEEEVLLLSGMNSAAGYEDENSLREIPGGSYNPDITDPSPEPTPPPVRNQRQYREYDKPDDDVLEQEAVEFIGGYSAVPNRANTRENLNVPPIIDAGDNYMDSEFFEESDDSLDLKDFLEEEPEEPEVQKKHEITDDPGFIKYKNHYSFLELLEEEPEPEPVDNYGGDNYPSFRNPAFSPDMSPVSVLPQEAEEGMPDELLPEPSSPAPGILPDEKEEALKKPVVKDDQISISGKNGKKKKDDGIILPGKPEKKDSGDMTRMTSVNMGNAPRDSTFGIRDIRGPMMPKEKSDVAMVGEKISIGGKGLHPSDKSLSAGNFSAGSKLRPKDTAFGGGSVTPGKKITPNDSTFSGSGISMAKRAVVNDSTFSGSGIPMAKKMDINDNAISGGTVNLRPKIMPKDDSIGGFSSQSKVKKPRELLSGGVRVKPSSSRPKDDIFVKSGIKEKPGAGRPSSRGKENTNINHGKGEPSRKKTKNSEDEDLFWA